MFYNGFTCTNLDLSVPKAKKGSWYFLSPTVLDKKLALNQGPMVKRTDFCFGNKVMRSSAWQIFGGEKSDNRFSSQVASFFDSGARRTGSAASTCNRPCPQIPLSPVNRREMENRTGESHCTWVRVKDQCWKGKSHTLVRITVDSP